MVGMIPIIAGGVGGIVLLCICCACCVCGYCSVQRKKTNKKKAAAAKNKKKKAAAAKRQSSIAGGAGGNNAMMNAPPSMQYPHSQLQAPMMMPPQQIAIPMQQQQYVPSGAASVVMGPNGQHSVIYPSGAATVAGTVAPPAPAPHPQIVVIRDSDNNNRNNDQQNEGKIARSASMGDMSELDLATSIHKLNETLVRNQNGFNYDNDIDSLHNQRDPPPSSSYPTSRRSSTGDLTSDLATSIRTLHDSLDQHRRGRDGRRSSLRHSIESDSSGLNSELSDSIRLIDSMNKLTDTLERKEAMEEEKLRRGQSSSSSRHVQSTSRSTESSDSSDQQWESNKIVTMRRTVSAGALSSTGRTAGTTSSFVPSKIYKPQRTSEKRRLSNAAPYTEMQFQLDSLAEHDAESIGSLTHYEDEEMGITTRTIESSSDAGGGEKNSSVYQSGASTKSASEQSLSLSTQQSKSIVIGKFGHRDVVDVIAPPGILGLILDSPDDGWPVIHVVKNESVVLDQVEVGDRIMSIDGTDVRTLTSFEVSVMLNQFKEGKRTITVLRA